ncbi:hypothetical protein Bbelb_303220 [Branchiostoma belcheri]|nr:hypothetical protein Bbelb_303220 [Branchiostoma belcheri]
MSIYLLKPVCLRCVPNFVHRPLSQPCTLSPGESWTPTFGSGRDLSGQSGGTQGTSARLAGPGQLLVRPGVLSLYPACLPYFLYEYSIACLLRLYVSKDRQSVE